MKTRLNSQGIGGKRLVLRKEECARVVQTRSVALIGNLILYTYRRPSAPRYGCFCFLRVVLETYPFKRNVEAQETGRYCYSRAVQRVLYCTWDPHTSSRAVSECECALRTMVWR